jgi:hypothetical protein
MRRQGMTTMKNAEQANKDEEEQCTPQQESLGLRRQEQGGE